MWTVALSQLRTQPRRYVSVVLAILIGTMFLAASFLVSSTAQATLRTTLGSTYAGADLVVLPRESGDAGGAPEDAGAAESVSPVERFPVLAGTADAPGSLDRVPGVAEAYAPTLTFAVLGEGEGTRGFVLPAPEDPSVLGVRPLEGAFPAAGDPSGVAVDDGTAERLGLGVGDRLTLHAADATAEATVTGIVEGSPDPMLSSGAQAWTGAPTVAALTAEGETPFAASLLLRLDEDADPAAVREDVAAALASDGVAADVRTPDEAVREELTRMGGGTDLLGWVLGAFAALALVVTALVIANTFQVLVAQRTRDLALLRTIGASVRQVRGAVLVEALVAGVVGSVAGVALAVGLTAAVVAVARGAFGLRSLTFGVAWTPLLATVLVGVAVAVLAALAPARAATRVAPLQALRPAAETEVLSRTGVLRAVVGAVLAVGGAALMWHGAWNGGFAAAVGGGVLSFLGMFLLARLFVPALVRAAAVLARPAGVPGRLAGLNATRHRSRTAATAAALLVGTTLVALVLTGGRTAQQETDRLLDVEFPVDLVVSVPDAGRAQAAADAVAGLGQVGAVAPAWPVGATEAGTPAYEVSPQALRSVVAQLPPEESRHLGEEGTVFVPAWADPTTTLTVDGGPQEMRSVRGSGLDTGVFVVPSGRPAGTGPHDAGPALVLVALADDVGVDGLQGLSEDVVAAAGPEARIVDGGAPERAVYARVIDAMLWIVVALLAVSVLIALIGVANTLSLSVIERTRENALLRALGLSRRGLRGMIAIEAVLIAAVAAALGCALGVFYGWAGSQLILGELVQNLDGVRRIVWPAVPWLELALVVAVAAAAGLAASLLPARRAVRLSPVEGLATV